MRNLRSLREAKGLTQAQLADKAGINQATISKIEAGRANFTFEMIERISAALGVTEAELFGTTELHTRILQAIGQMEPDQQQAALLVLESMVKR